VRCAGSGVLAATAIAVGASVAVPGAAAQDTSVTVSAGTLPSVTLPAALDRVLRDYERLWKGGDAAGLAALFTEDGFVLSNFNTPVRGRAAIRERYASSGGVLRLRALSHSTDGDTGYIIGAYRYDDARTDNGKFILALRRVNGRWLIAADIDNTNRRPRP
jgi:ketosteroid isomerase-like protein